MEENGEGRPSDIMPVWSRENGAVLFLDIKDKTLITKVRMTERLNQD